MDTGGGSEIERMERVYRRIQGVEGDGRGRNWDTAGGSGIQEDKGG